MASGAVSSPGTGTGSGASGESSCGSPVTTTSVSIAPATSSSLADHDGTGGVTSVNSLSVGLVDSVTSLHHLPPPWSILADSASGMNISYLQYLNSITTTIN